MYLGHDIQPRTYACNRGSRITVCEKKRSNQPLIHIYMCVYTRISWNTRSSNPLLETRLIPRIAICLWRPLLRRYWLRVISCKLGCLATGSLAPGARSHMCKPGTRTPVLVSFALRRPSPRSIRQFPDVRLRRMPFDRIVVKLTAATARARTATFPESCWAKEFYKERVRWERRFVRFVLSREGRSDWFYNIIARRS